MFIYPNYYHNWRNICTIYITGLASKEIFSPLNKVHRGVGRAKDLSTPRYLINSITWHAGLATSHCWKWSFFRNQDCGYVEINMILFLM